jgi:hypothetical protein
MGRSLLMMQWRIDVEEPTADISITTPVSGSSRITIRGVLDAHHSGQGLFRDPASLRIDRASTQQEMGSRQHRVN